MEKRKTCLFSLVFFLIVLLILGQQEIEKTKDLLKDLANKEVNNFIFTSSDFADIVKTEATPLILWANSRSIENLLVTKCRLGENVFLQEAGGQELVLNSYGDAGVIQYELERGGKVIPASEQMEIDYFKKEAVPSFRVDGFSSWQIFFYFFKRVFLLLVVTLAPLLLSLKLFILLFCLLTIVISLLATKEVAGENHNVKVVKEFCLQKPPPKISTQTIVYHNTVVLNEFIILNKLTEYVPLVIKMVFPDELIERTRKAVNKIFHIPKYNFVLNQTTSSFDLINELIFNYGRK